jgi:serine/threonine-protein kinase RsbW
MFSIVSNNQWNLFLQSSLEEVSKIAPFIDSIPPLRRLKEDKMYFLKLSIHEAVTNAILHGNNSDIHKKIGISLVVEKDKCVITVSDEGQGFTKDLYIQKTQNNTQNVGGRGLLLIHQSMDSVSFQQSGDKFILSMTLLG